MLSLYSTTPTQVGVAEYKDSWAIVIIIPGKMCTFTMLWNIYRHVLNACRKGIVQSNLTLKPVLASWFEQLSHASRTISCNRVLRLSWACTTTLRSSCSKQSWNVKSSWEKKFAFIYFFSQQILLTRQFFFSNKTE